ncbi:alpha/beta fold hydrolase [Aquirhabdus parva]|uniref:alpha/beta fold hydrolase n=1 Tax=Aquirhabdus parva TaxID=2283318 RepID=UPI0013B3F4BB|nr:alpha/beta hydrolase [Aquirhabdus parva]
MNAQINPKGIWHRFALTLFYCYAIFLTGCASLPNKTVTQLDQRQVEYVATHHGQPVIVFESGIAGTIDEWSDVFPTISKEYSALTYNRPGHGKSVTTQSPRDGDHIIDELRLLLLQQGYTPPYILVGHSMGGFYMQYFARRYPEEVQALVLVDSAHPKQVEGNGSIEHYPLVFRLMFDWLASPTTKEEYLGMFSTGRKMLALPTVTGKPVIILNAAKALKDHSALANDWNAMRWDLPKLYPGSQQIWVDSNHDIPHEQPQAVIDAIHTAVATSTPPTAIESSSNK